MKTCNLSVATVVLGALAVSYAACSAQGQDNTYPGAPIDYAGSSSSAAGSAGRPNNPPTGGSGAPGVQAGAGAPPAAGGSPFNTGVGGAFVSGGRSGAGAPGAAGARPTGGAGAPTTSGCTAAVGAVADVLIDDLEDGDNTIKATGSRVGYWYTYNDGTATQVPDPKVLFKGVTPGHMPTTGLSATTSGPAFTKYGAGMGFDFNNTASKSCAYDASAYTGIKFWAKANTGNMAAMTLKAMIKIPATTPTTADGGTCTGTCEDHFYLKPAPALTATWAQYTMPFATIAQDGFGTKVASFDKAHILAMQFQVAQNIAFNFSVDDITFY